MPLLSTILLTASTFLLLPLTTALPQFSQTFTPADSTLYPNPGNQPFCNAVGDCTSLHVKWGHPSPYITPPNNTTYIIPADSTTTVQSLFNYILGATTTTPNNTIDGSADFGAPGNPLKFRVVIDDGEVQLDWSDVADQSAHLYSIGNVITQGFGGLLWDMNDAGRVVGSYSLGPQ